MGEFDPNFGHLKLPRVDVHHGAYEFFASPEMFYVHHLPDHHRLVKKDQGAVGIHHLGRRAFTERGAIGMFSENNHSYAEEDALAAALMGHVSLTRIVSDTAQGPLLWVFACMSRAIGSRMLYGDSHAVEDEQTLSYSAAVRRLLDALYGKPLHLEQ
jgi:hypothetical protein